MEIIGYDGYLKHFEFVERDKVKCKICNTIFEVYKDGLVEGGLTKELKSHRCPGREPDLEVLRIARKYEKFLRKQRNSLASENKI